MLQHNASWEWSIAQALHVFFKTYWEDFGGARQQRRALLSHPHIEEFPFDCPVSGLQAVSNNPQQPVFFLHGTPGNAMRWTHYLKHVPDGYRYYAIDRPGFELAADNPSHLEKDYQRILSCIRDLSGDQKPIIAGHSLGGAIVARLAADMSNDLAGVLFIASSVDPSLERVLPAQYLAVKAPFSWLLCRSVRHSNLEMIQLEAFMERTVEQMAEIKCPVGIVHPQDDKLVPYAHVDFMLQKFVNAAFIELQAPETGGHSIPWTQPDLICQTIDALCQKQKEKAA